MKTDKAKHHYRASLIGCGSMGSYAMDELEGLKTRMILPFGHAETINTHPQIELMAGSDPDTNMLKDFGKRWDVSALYTDHIQMLENEKIDIVCIASPPDLHKEHVIDCAKHGVKGIFCEKPLAPTLREADELIQACKKYNVRLAINHTRRGDPFVHQAQKLIEEGAIGDLLTITVIWPGRLFLTGSHCYDLANYFAGDVDTDWLVGHTEDPESTMNVIPTQRGVDIGGNTYLVYSNGIRAFFNGRGGHATMISIELHGSKGMINLNDYETELWISNESSKFHELLRHPFPQKMYYKAPMEFLLEDLIHSIEDGHEPMSNGYTARHALEQILATHDSSQNDNIKIHFPFPKLDMSTSYRWLGKDGKVEYFAHNPGAKDD